MFTIHPRGEDDEAISVWRWSNGDGCVLAVKEPAYPTRHSVIPAPQVPEVARGVVTAMHEMAGLPAPVILDRPGTLALDVLPGIRFAVNGSVIEAERPGGNWQLTPAAARSLAASLAIIADEAECEPDPAEVEKLTAAIRTAPGMEGIATADVIARHILRAYRLEMRDRRD